MASMNWGARAARGTAAAVCLTLLSLGGCQALSGLSGLEPGPDGASGGGGSSANQGGASSVNTGGANQGGDGGAGGGGVCDCVATCMALPPAQDEPCGNITICTAACEVAGDAVDCAASTCTDFVTSLFPCAGNCEGLGDCGLPVCMPDGSCGAQAVDSMCEAGEGCHERTRQCVPASCANGTKDTPPDEFTPGETDVDCGGPFADPVCPLCAINEDCKDGIDCETGLCFDQGGDNFRCSSCNMEEQCLFAGYTACGDDGSCVRCQNNSDCYGVGRPFCDITLGICINCLADSECDSVPGSNGKCDSVLGNCLATDCAFCDYGTTSNNCDTAGDTNGDPTYLCGSLTDEQCQEAGHIDASPGTTCFRCGPLGASDDACRQLGWAGGCISPGGDPMKSFCGGCTNDAQCQELGFPGCDGFTGRCTKCNTNTECHDIGYPSCDAGKGVCNECDNNINCRALGFTECESGGGGGFINRCKACDGDSDCPGGAAGACNNGRCACVGGTCGTAGLDNCNMGSGWCGCSTNTQCDPFGGFCDQQTGSCG